MIFLLAQLVAPPTQIGPVRLPAPNASEQRPGRPGSGSKPPAVLEAPTQEPAPKPPAQPAAPAGAPASDSSSPRIDGPVPYDASQLDEIFRSCRQVAVPQERLNACAAALTARLVAQGYVSTRVFVTSTAGNGILQVIPGRIVELRVNGSDERLNRRVQRLLRPLRGQLLNLPDVEQQLQLLRRQAGVGAVRANLSRLGSDASQAVLVINVSPGTQPWQGDFSLRDDGSGGSGQFRAVGTLLKPSAAVRGDTLLLYGEVDASNAPEFGSLITSLSYTLPLSDQVNFTTALGFSRRNLIELAPPGNGFSTSQYQGLGQFEWVFSESLRHRWSAFVAYSQNRSNTYFNDQVLPDVVQEVVRQPSNGYLRLGVSGSGVANRYGWNGNAYLLQGVPASVPATQQAELEQAGINPSQATAVGGLISGAWAFAPSWQLNARLGGQWAFNPLLTSMQFALGSDVGIRGLPGQLVSGDTGILGTLETVWTFWQKKNQALQLVPFIGAGQVTTNLGGISFTDSVGSGGLMMRWLAGDNFSTELGWVGQFFTNDNPGPWQNALIGNGLYFKLGYRF